MWYIPLSRVDFILCLTNDYIAFSVFCSTYTVWNFQNYACYFFIWPNHKYILEQFLIIFEFLSTQWYYLIQFNSIFKMNNPLWTINRHFLHMYALVLFLHLICSNWPNWTPKLRWWRWISNFLPASYKNNFKIQVQTLPVCDIRSIFSTSESLGANHLLRNFLISIYLLRYKLDRCGLLVPGVCQCVTSYEVL
jgi:hypothetical protein